MSKTHGFDLLAKNFQRFGRLVRGDSATRLALLLRVIQTLAGPVNSLLLVLCMSIEEQGIYYLFMGLLAVRIVFELGAATAVGQLAAHNIPVGASEVPRSFVAAVNRWMSRAALLMAVVAGTGGIIFLILHQHGDVSSLLSWTLLVLGSAFGLITEGKLAILYGSGSVGDFFRIRLIGGVILIGLNWVLLALGAGLFSFGLSVIISLMVCEFLCWKHSPSLFTFSSGPYESEVRQFSVQIRKLLSKVSCVSLPVYLAGNIQAMVCLHSLGATSLALLGFATAIGNSAIGISGAWLHAALPQLTAIGAKKDLPAAQRFFRKHLFLAIVGIGGGCAASVAAMAILSTFPRFSARLPEWPVIALILAGISAQNLMGALVLWPRAFLLEPFGWVGISQMLLLPGAMYMAAECYSLPGLALANLLVWAGGVIAVLLTWPRIQGSMERVEKNF